MYRGGKTLTLNAVNDGVITFNDAITGVTGYNIRLTGDESGTINFTNNYYTQVDDTLVKTTTAAVLNSANVTVDGGVTVNLGYADNALGNYNFNSLKISDGTVNLAIDVDALSGGNDKIKTATTSSGTININDLNIINSHVMDSGESDVYKILNTNEGLSLALNKTKYITKDLSTILRADTISANIDVV